MDTMKVCELSSSKRMTKLVDEICLSDLYKWEKINAAGTPDVFIVEHEYQWLPDCFDRQAVLKRNDSFFLDLVGEYAAKRLLSKKAALIIDGSTEGMVRWNSLVSLKKELEKKCIPQSQALLITANYKQSLPAVVEDGFEIFHHNVYFYKGVRLASQVTVDPVAILNRRFEEIEHCKDFICMNFTIRPHRIMLVAGFIVNNVFDSGLISFGNLNSPSGWKNMDTAQDNVRSELKRLFNADETVLAAVDVLRKKGRILIDTSIENPTNIEYLIPIEFAHKTLFSVVTETAMGYGAFGFVTEKTVKPIAMLQPFIIVGSPDSLSYLKSIGIKTFRPWINEDYDEEPNPIKRLGMIQREIVRLVNLSVEAKRSMLKEMKEVLIANYYILKNELLQNMDKKWTKPIYQACCRCINTE